MFSTKDNIRLPDLQGPGPNANRPTFSSLTISDDQSAGSDANERKLLALKESRTDANTGTSANQNEALSDYQMQLKLLEQQNMKRRMMTRSAASNSRNETDNGEKHTPSSTAQGDPATLQLPTVSIADETISSAINNIQSVIGGDRSRELDLAKILQCMQGLSLQNTQIKTIQQAQIPSRYQVLYRFVTQSNNDAFRTSEDQSSISTPFFDEPKWINGQCNKRRLYSELPVSNFDLYLEQNKDVAFLIYRDYNPDPSKTAYSDETDSNVVSRAMPFREIIRPISKPLVEAIETILTGKLEYKALLEQFKTSRELMAPYLFTYHSRGDMGNIMENLPTNARSQVNLLLSYVYEQYSHHYDAADAQFARNRVSVQYLPYLFKPGDTLVEQDDGKYQAFVATSWPMPAPAAEDSVKSLYDSLGSGRSKAKRQASAQDEQVEKQKWFVGGWHWIFDGNFQREHSDRHFEIDVLKKSQSTSSADPADSSTYMADQHEQGRFLEVPITNLRVYPIKYAESGLVQQLSRRGNTFWSCRERHFVSYMEVVDSKNGATTEERYMVDLKTYRELHANRSSTAFVPSLRNDLTNKELASEKPPTENFELLLPPEIKGYNLRRKKWFNLDVDRITEVAWNTEAFKSLVIDSKSRDLILALVSNHISTSKSTDIIAGKGNGLILLLHGGPGTGKTLTAESVAEIARKPLYRVTCGDVGTKAEEVEQYLESVLHLGKIWDCVVLLDEADVFLEQRSLEDLNRNALVSVFLRVLEYYEGILILTSNRVGTFDDAFRSRIQLALHYPCLDRYQRMRIWENFVNRLESFGDDKVDVADVRAHLGDLSEENMNGREIRNAITTARQYAEWKGVVMSYAHLKDVIEVAGRFDTYLEAESKGVDVERDRGDVGSEWTGLN